MSARTLPVVLVGLPGAGKSKVGALLALRLGVPHLDTDSLVVDHEGRTINQIFAEDGESAFRVMERNAVAHALTMPAVVSLGGGAVTTPEVREVLRAHTVVYIDAAHEELLRRTASAGHRPLLAGDPSGTLRRLREEREPHYREVASFVVSSGPGSADDVVSAIIDHLEQA